MSVLRAYFRATAALAARVVARVAAGLTPMTGCGRMRILLPPSPWQRPAMRAFVRCVRASGRIPDQQSVAENHMDNLLRTRGGTASSILGTFGPALRLTAIAVAVQMPFSTLTLARDAAQDVAQDTAQNAAQHAKANEAKANEAKAHDAKAQAAANAADAPASVNELSAVTITGYRFYAPDTSGITRLPLPVEKVPQSASLVTGDFAKAAGLETMGEIAQYTTGAYYSGYIPSYGSQVLLRGLNAGYAIDGLTVGDQIAEPDSVTLARYEVIKGPASVAFGAQNPGGIVNLVQKNAFDAPDYLSVSGGSWGRWRVEGQGTTALNSDGTVRAIGVFAQEQGDSQVDFVHSKKSVLYGGVDFDLGDDLTGYVRLNHQRFKTTGYNGIPVHADGSLPDLPRSFFVGGSDYATDARATSLSAGLTWMPSALWAFDLKTLFQKTDHRGVNAYAAGYLQDDGDFAVSGAKYDPWNVYDFTTDLSVTRRLDDLGLEGSSVSADVRYQRYRYSIAQDYLAGTANIHDGDEAVSRTINGFEPGGAGSYEQDQVMSYLTASTQAVIKVAQPVSLVGGVAYSRPRIRNQVNDGPRTNLDPGGQFSYRAALVYEPIEGLNVYGSYSESFMPNLRVDENYQVLPPMKGRQYEIGVKRSLADGKLLLSAAVFDLRQSNVAVYDKVVDNETLYKTASVRHRGLELEATGKITSAWQIRAGLALLDPEVSDDPSNPASNGQKRTWIPRQTASLYTTHDIGHGLSLGGGVRYVGRIKTSYDGSTPDLSSYVLVDGGIGYSIDRWHFQLNVKNIFDRKYHLGTWSTLAYGVYPGMGRSAMLTARVEL